MTLVELYLKKEHKYFRSYDPFQVVIAVQLILIQVLEVSYLGETIPDHLIQMLLVCFPSSQTFSITGQNHSLVNCIQVLFYKLCLINRVGREGGKGGEWSVFVSEP